MYEDSFVKIMKCRFCGKDTNALALHKQLKPIKDDVFDPEPCERCKELFNTHKYFIGDCGHSGFIKTDALEKITKEKEFLRIKNVKIFRMVKCFTCLGLISIDNCSRL